MVKKDSVTGWVGWWYSHTDLRDPHKAAGMCYDVSNIVQEKFGFKNLIYTFHGNDPMGRFETLGQHSDHYAIMHRGKVLDYTLRQFDPSTPWPFYGTIQEWKSVLEAAWDTTVDHHILSSVDDAEFIKFGSED